MHKEETHKTRSLILEKARDLFLEQGYHKTSMRTIANAAGISTWPLYTHFKNKAEVFLAICEEGYELMLNSFTPLASSNKHSMDRLRDILYAYRDIYENKKQYYQIMKLAITPIAGIDLPEEMLQKIYEYQHKVDKIIENIIQEGIEKGEIRKGDTKEYVLVLTALANGVLQHYDTNIIKYSGKTLDQVIEKTLELVQLALVIE